MKFDNFTIGARQFIRDAYCKNDSSSLVEVGNDWFSVALFCPKCEAVYIPKMIRLPASKVTEEFLKQAREQVALRDKIGDLLYSV